MSSQFCPANCENCNHDIIPHEEEHTVSLTNDKSLTYIRKGYLCRQESFFFLDEKALHQEGQLIDKFIRSCVA